MSSSEIDNASVNDPAESRASKTLRDAFESGRPLTYVRSSEEQRVASVLAEVGSRLFAAGPVPVWSWSLTEGMRRGREAAGGGKQSAREALDFIATHDGPAIFHLKDFHEPLRESPEIRRRLRDLYESCLDQRKYIVITSPVRVRHPPRSGWLDELDRLKGGWSIGLDVARCAS